MRKNFPKMMEILKEIVFDDSQPVSAGVLAQSLDISVEEFVREAIPRLEMVKDNVILMLKNLRRIAPPNTPQKVLKRGN